jgi:predicted enzyme related to lactoylglutathione lyase
MPTTTLHVDDVERAMSLYEAVFELEPILGPSSFNDGEFRWAEWEQTLPSGLDVIVRLVEANGDANAFPADTLGLLFASDLDATCARAVANGFEIASKVETIRDDLSIVRLRDPDGNRLVAGNGNLWVRNGGVQS